MTPAPRSSSGRASARKVEQPQKAEPGQAAQKQKATPDPVELPAPVETAVVSVSCLVPGCTEDPELRGLCPAHRQTHRGLLGPKEK